MAPEAHALDEAGNRWGFADEDATVFAWAPAALTPRRSMAFPPTASSKSLPVRSIDATSLPVRISAPESSGPLPEGGDQSVRIEVTVACVIGARDQTLAADEGGVRDDLLGGEPFGLDSERPLELGRP